MSKIQGKRYAYKVCQLISIVYFFNTIIYHFPNSLISQLWLSAYKITTTSVHLHLSLLLPVLMLRLLLTTATPKIFSTRLPTILVRSSMHMLLRSAVLPMDCWLLSGKISNGHQQQPQPHSTAKLRCLFRNQMAKATTTPSAVTITIRQLVSLATR